MDNTSAQAATTENLPDIIDRVMAWWITSSLDDGTSLSGATLQIPTTEYRRERLTTWIREMGRPAAIEALRAYAKSPAELRAIDAAAEQPVTPNLPTTAQVRRADTAIGDRVKIHVGRYAGTSGSVEAIGGAGMDLLGLPAVWVRPDGAETRVPYRMGEIVLDLQVEDDTELPICGDDDECACVWLSAYDCCSCQDRCNCHDAGNVTQSA